MNVITVVNQKGGVGKTTTTVSLSGVFAARGEKVLVIDSDPHGSLSSYFRMEVHDSSGTLYSVFDNNSSSSDIIRSTDVKGIDIVCAHELLATVERIPSSRGRGLLLKKFIEGQSGKYDHVIIDCPPVLGVLMVNAIAAAGKLVIPVFSEYLALNGLDKMINTINMVSRSLGTAIDYLIVPTAFDRRTKVSFDCLERMRASYRARLWNAVIPVDTNFRLASLKGLPVSHMPGKCRGAAAYEMLARVIAPVTIHNEQEFAA